jgi:hypothetical protein
MNTTVAGVTDFLNYHFVYDKMTDFSKVMIILSGKMKKNNVNNKKHREKI